MKKIVLLSFVSLILFGCNNFDKNTPDGYGGFILDKLIAKEFDVVKSLYASPSDTISVDSVALKRLNFWFKDSIKINRFNTKIDDEINEWKSKAKSTNIESADIEFLRTELDTTRFETPYSEMKVYFLLNKKEYFFKLYNVLKTRKGWVFYRITPFMSQEELAEIERKKREEKAKQPYTPYGINFKSCNWEYKYASPKTFSNFFVTLKNTTSNNFKKIKFRVTIYKNDGYPKTEVFSKIIEKNESIYAGDVVRFEVDELRDFYSGVNITDKDNFDWKAVLVDAKPRPGYENMPF
jgi:hypothetical protein